MNKSPKPGDLLNCEDGAAVVVAEGCTPVEGLLSLIDETWGGLFTADNPAVVAALHKVRVERWRYCTLGWRESEGIDRDEYDGYWSPNGDGARSIVVASYDGSVYSLGDEAADFAPVAAGEVHP